jgi:OOP family OmpA-OmpF porin
MTTTGLSRSWGWLLVAGLALIASTGCTATYKNRAPYGAYWLAGAGASSTDVEKSSAFTGSVDKTDLAWTTAAGITFARYGAFEVGYVDLGKVGYDGEFGSVPNAGSIRSRGWKTSLFGNLPLGKRVRLQGEAGWFWWQSQEREYFGPVEETSSASGDDVMYGAGVEFDASRRVALRLLFEQFRDVGQTDELQGEPANLATLSVVIKFGPNNKKK